jgi:large subunit ribosomal protein L9
MKVVLRSDLDSLGKRGDIVEVADGYARNALLPQRKAIPATKGITEQAAAMRRSRDVKDAKAREGAEAIARRLVPIEFRVTARAGREGRLFGSVTMSDLVALVEQETGIVLDRHRLLSEEPIKTVGTHAVWVRLHPEVEFQLTVEVVSQ